jgi:stage V sporulation protein SpoVS
VPALPSPQVRLEQGQLCTIDAAMGRALAGAVNAVAQARPLLRKRGVDCCVVPMWVAAEGMDGERMDLMQLRVVQCQMGELGEVERGGALVLRLRQPPGRPRHSVQDVVLARRAAGGEGGGEGGLGRGAAGAPGMRLGARGADFDLVTDI